MGSRLEREIKGQARKKMNGKKCNGYRCLQSLAWLPPFFSSLSSTVAHDGGARVRWGGGGGSEGRERKIMFLPDLWCASHVHAPLVYGPHGVVMTAHAT